MGKCKTKASYSSFIPCLVLKICGTPKDDCSEFATCTDTARGEYNCKCNEGYNGDGKKCEGLCNAV